MGLLYLYFGFVQSQSFHQCSVVIIIIIIIIIDVVVYVLFLPKDKWAAPGNLSNCGTVSEI